MKLTPSLVPSRCVFNHGFMHTEFGAHLGKHSKGWRHRRLGPPAAPAEAPLAPAAERARASAAAASLAVALASAIALLVLLLRRFSNSKRGASSPR